MSRVSIKNIAKQGGVSISTVSLALRNCSRISPETKRKIQSIALGLKYRPHLLARGLKSGKKTQTVGIVLPKINDSFFMDILTAQEQRLREKNYMSIWVVSNRQSKLEIEGIRQLLDRGIDGLVFNYDSRNIATQKELRNIVNLGKPVSFFWDNGIKGADVVRWTAEKCGYEMTKHLLDYGHSRTAIIIPNANDERLLGYRKALEESGIPFDPKKVFVCTYSFQDIVELRKEIMSVKDYPTAIFAYNDDLAGELISDLISVGYRIPDDISVVGVNDSRKSGKLQVPLTTYRLPCAEIGHTIVEFLVERIENPSIQARERTFEGELVIRSSSGPASMRSWSGDIL